MTELLQVVILAVVQGVAEFLPVSSSGHIVVLNTAFGELGDTLTLNIVLHLGTLGAILVVYWKRILRLLKEDRRVIPLIIVGTIPAVIVGVPLEKYCDSVLENAMLAGFMFIVTGGFLLYSRGMKGDRECRELTWRDALLIGCFQAFAILPGISRSGSTIVAGLFAGLKREEAATFSFLLAIPVIAGGGLLKVIDLITDGPSADTNLSLLGIGAGISFAVGVVSLLWLIRWLERGRLQYFAAYLFVLGPLVVLWRLFA